MANPLNTITVDGVTYDAEQYAKDHAAVAKAGGDLGKDTFLQLLVAQMKYQDPLNPQDNSEYLAELANFSALEQMTNVAENLENLSSVVGGISSAVASNTSGLTDLSLLVSNLDSSILVGQLSGMIGKGINWKTSSSEYENNGVVKGVTISDGEVKVAVQSGSATFNVSIGEITKIYAIDDTSSEEDAEESEELAEDVDTTEDTIDE